ncbi:AI-2E family transporter [Massilia sp. YIM B02763]|uniref:AI-2E family transporter n=1 Tax=Massilia sp. YIM B02763 TaxID=3050130 RepID=UPI0025B62AB6|nr:AI-2E family transporter [Massilia sp. YIM B02763]MDN4054876.1 AI-2E family transporter [Massilia sp. YIM B02763]
MRDSSLFKYLGSGSIVTACCVLGLLYFGRDVIQPLALASILSLVIAPLIRSMRRFGLSHMPATLLSVIIVASCVIGVGTILAFQLVAVSHDLPKYRAAIRTKVAAVREFAERPFARLEAELTAVSPQERGAVTARRGITTVTVSPTQPLPVEIRQPRLTTSDQIQRLFSVAWGPIGEAGLVLVLLVFITLEHESLRDRVIRLAGQAEVGRTIRALSDAAQGVSRFFFSQFVVNLTFGTLIGLLLWLAGVPHAGLWGALSAMLRFVPYLGVMAAGLTIAVFVAAIDPGWQLAVSCIALFLALELFVANVVEPKVYGHSSGLSPLAVIVSAVFWGAMWGPIGLLLSTPLTLCLVVAGRHVRGLEPVTILLGDAPSVSGAQRLYQRVLAGDTETILRDARAYLRRASFARYCDQVLLPGLTTASADIRSGQIDDTQLARIRATIADVASQLTPDMPVPIRSLRRRNVSLLDANLGAHLRQMREERQGRWQGSLDVPAHSVVLCAGLASERDGILSELLVRALREGDIDARSFTLLETKGPGPDYAELISTIFLPYPMEEHLATWLTAALELRNSLPTVLLATVRPPFDRSTVPQSAIENHIDIVLRSFEEALAFVSPEKPARG